MLIEELHLTSFKGFRDFTLKCSQFTTLAGLNNSGKTSILRAIQLAHDILKFAFGNKERPDFSAPQWVSNPTTAINRISSGDPDALWLHKKTGEACIISVKYSGNVELILEIAGRNQYRLDLCVNGSSVTASEIAPQFRQTIAELFVLRPSYVPPLGTVAPGEDHVTHPQLMSQLEKGRSSQFWRARLFWQYNDGRKERFHEVAQTVQKYLPNARILPPALTHDSPSQIEISFEEEGTDFDISTSGGGLRTILDLASTMVFSNSKCILFDEPDAHLHGSLQRSVARMLFDYAQENEVQVFVATHSPEFLKEVPLEHLVWIDRNEQSGRACDSLGRLLVNLGAISSIDALRAKGANKLLFVEGSLDRQILAHLFGLTECRNPFEDEQLIVANLRSGKGDRCHIEAFRRLLLEALEIEMAVGCITDMDYDITERGKERESDKPDCLLLTLARKEVENYLLDAQAIKAAAEKDAELRRRQGRPSVQGPTIEEIDAKMDALMDGRGIRSQVKCQVLPRYRETLPGSMDDATKEKRAEDWFGARWKDREWRIAHCPGKQVLAGLRTWLKKDFSLNLSAANLCSALVHCPNDVAEMAAKLTSYFYSNAET